MRNVLLTFSESAWMRERATRYRFVRRAVSRFMPGETAEEALSCACQLKEQSIGSVFTLLGENVKDPSEAERVTQHYLDLLDRINALMLESEVSVKLTQLGLDLDREMCRENLLRIVERANAEGTVWIDMESSAYVDPTLRIYRRVLADYANAGICLQAYLHRTPSDVEQLLPQKPTIRLVKGAYREAPDVAAQYKARIDSNYLQLAERLVSERKTGNLRRVILATHDPRLIGNIVASAAQLEIRREELEFQMLYGIQRAEQERLARAGFRSSVLIAYGTHWYAWFMRRLAERPANVWLVLRNLAAS